MLNVKRNGLVFGVMVAGICLMLWAGWHNLRERRLALERARESHMAVMPQAPAAGQNAGNSAGQGTGQPDLQGKAAPAFTLVDLNGKKVSLKDYKGRPVLV